MRKDQWKRHRLYHESSSTHDSLDLRIDFLSDPPPLEFFNGFCWALSHLSDDGASRMGAHSNLAQSFWGIEAIFSLCQKVDLCPPVPSRKIISALVSYRGVGYHLLAIDPAVEMLN